MDSAELEDLNPEKSFAQGNKENDKKQVLADLITTGGDFAVDIAKAIWERGIVRVEIAEQDLQFSNDLCESYKGQRNKATSLLAESEAARKQLEVQVNELKEEKETAYNAIDCKRVELQDQNVGLALENLQLTDKLEKSQEQYNTVNTRYIGVGEALRNQKSQIEELESQNSNFIHELRKMEIANGKLEADSEQSRVENAESKIELKKLEAENADYHKKYTSAVDNILKARHEAIVLKDKVAELEDQLREEREREVPHRPDARRTCHGTSRDDYQVLW